jgi:hypothetical protein
MMGPSVGVEIISVCKEDKFTAFLNLQCLPCFDTPNLKHSHLSQTSDSHGPYGAWRPIRSKWYVTCK